jgi:hypothetical protein
MTQRRRSPQWIREKPSRDLHGIAGKFQRGRTTGDLSEAQEALWDCCISELEWRFRHPSPEWPYCTCEFCFFPLWEELELPFGDPRGEPF